MGRCLELVGGGLIESLGGWEEGKGAEKPDPRGLSPLTVIFVDFCWVIAGTKQDYEIAGVLVRQGQGIREAWGETDLTKEEVKSAHGADCVKKIDQ